jgi:hypothetical protein
MPKTGALNLPWLLPLLHQLREEIKMALWFETLFLLLVFFGIGLGIGYMIWKDSGRAA